MYEGWEIDADLKADDMLYGWEAVQAMLAEDESYAQYLFEAFHGREH